MPKKSPTSQTSKQKTQADTSMLAKEDLEELLSKKLENIATSADIDDLRSLINDQKKLIDEQKELIMDQKKLIKNQNTTIKDLENKLNKNNDQLAILRSVIEKTKMAAKENEQYSRRLCLCITAIPQEYKETANQALKNVSISS